MSSKRSWTTSATSTTNSTRSRRPSNSLRKSWITRISLWANFDWFTSLHLTSSFTSPQLYYITIVNIRSFFISCISSFLTIRKNDSLFHRHKISSHNIWLTYMDNKKLISKFMRFLTPKSLFKLQSRKKLSH